MAKRTDFNFKEVLRRITNDPTLPRRLGSIAVNHFKQSFVAGGFTDKNFVAWKRRENDKTPNRATLVKSGDLKRSIKIRRATFKSVIVGTSGIPYAEIHNEGLPGIAFGKHRFVMPKRQFIGDSEVLEKKLKKRILQHVKQSFR